MYYEMQEKMPNAYSYPTWRVRIRRTGAKSTHPENLAVVTYKCSSAFVTGTFLMPPLLT